jgi:hypothetical protein
MTIKYCCKSFAQALVNYNLQYMTWSHRPEHNNRFEIFGYDMDREYPPLNYCPTCGTKIDHSLGVEKDKGQSIIMGEYERDI